MVQLDQISCFVSKGSSPFLIANSAPNVFTQGLNTAVVVFKDGLSSEIYLNGRNVVVLNQELITHQPTTPQCTRRLVDLLITQEDV